MNKLSQKQKLFAKNLIKTKGHKTKAYMLTYPDASEKSAQASSSRMLANKPEIATYVVEVMEQRGMSINNLVGKLKGLTSAKKENIMPSGEVVKTVDNPTRLSAVKTGLELHGALKSTPSINTDNRSINISMNSRDSAELSALTDKLEQLNVALLEDNGAQDGEIIDADFSKTDDTQSID